MTDKKPEQHLCHAVGCNERVLPSRLMCPRHWFMVPETVRRRVWQTYRPGQEVDKKPSGPWLFAAREAINHVAALEGKPGIPPDKAYITKTVESLLAQQGKEKP